MDDSIVELSNIEVAEVLNIQKSAASNRYIRALPRLKSILAAIPGFESDALSLSVEQTART